MCLDLTNLQLQTEDVDKINRSSIGESLLQNAVNMMKFSPRKAIRSRLANKKRRKKKRDQPDMEPVVEKGSFYGMQTRSQAKK